MFAKPATADEATETATPSRARRVVKLSAMTAVLVLVLAVAATALWANSMSNKFNEDRNVIDLSGHPGNAQPDMDELIDRPSPGPVSGPTEPAEETEADGPLNILLLGSDVRPDEEDARSDTIMVAHIPKDRGSVQLMSIPRDLWVPIPGHGKERINSAFSLEGAGLTAATIEDLLDIHIDHVAMIDFTGFAELTTALGGVKVDNPKEFTTTHGKEVTFKKGEITLKGEQALQYVRERKAFPDSDFTRVQNQQRVVRAVAEKTLSSETLTRPDKIEDLLDTLLPYLSVDEDLTAERLVEYGLQSKDIRGDDISSFTVPTGEPFTTSGGAQVLGVDKAGLKDLRKALADDSLEKFAKDHSAG